MDADGADILILEQCQGDFKPITPLTSVIPGSTLYYRKDRLLHRSWVECDGKNGYRTTKEGVLQLDKLIGKAPMGLSEMSTRSSILRNRSGPISIQFIRTSGTSDRYRPNKANSSMVLLVKAYATISHAVSVEPKGLWQR